MARSQRSRRARKPAHSSRKPSGNTRRLRLESLEPRLALATVLSPLVDRLDQHLDELPGDGGAAIINFTTGEEALVNPDQAFGTSSTIKSGILYALARKIDADDDLEWNSTITSGSQYGTNQGDTLVENEEYSLTELSLTMIINSNNWATNRLIQFIGMDQINEEFENLGLTQTRLNRYMKGDGAPSAHGTTGPGGDYMAGWDNLATPREITSMLRQIHENDDLLTNESYANYWNILNLDGDAGENTRGYSNDYYGSDGLDGYSGSLYPNWAPLMEFYNKAGSNSWDGDPGDFAGKPGLGDHWQRSEAGRVILANGDVLFYAAFADNATNAGEAEEWIKSVGYEMAFEHADSPVTYTPAAAQLDDGRVVVIRSGNDDDALLVRTSPTDNDNLQILSGGALLADIDTFNNNAIQLSHVYVYSEGGDDDVQVPSLPQVVPLTIDAGSGHDGVTTSPAAVIFGGSGNDVIVTGNGADFVQGDSGNDTITTNGGADIVLAGIGHDTVDGGSGADTLAGDDGDDQLTGGSGGDTLFGGEDDDELDGGDDSDVLWGGEGNDELHGGNQQDVLHGEDGDDVLDGGAHSDTLYGDAGSDLLVGGSSADTLDGGADNDQLIGGHQIPSLNSILSDGSGDTLLGGSGNDSIIADDGNFLPLIVRETAGGNDVVRGGSGNDLIFGGFGNDNIQGQVGNDTIAAGAGHDVVYGGSVLNPGQFLWDGDDYVNAGTGNDTVYGDNFDPSLPPETSALGGADEILGGDGNDTLYGQAGHDDLDGGLNSDLLDGGVGNDELTGGQGGDILRGASGTDLLFGNEGNDVIDGGADNDILVGGIGDDQLYGQDGNDSAGGEAGADLVVGGLGDDQLFGGDGNDKIIGGNHSLVADDGADTIDGEGGNDLILGDSGTTNPLNVTSAIGGNDTIQGGLGNDTIYAMAGNDFVGGGMGNDVLVLGEGNDIANGDSGDDSLTGGSGDDLLAGGAGADQLFGSDGADWLIGGNFAAVGIADPETDADTLDGGSGGDILLGDSWSAATPFDQGTEGGKDSLLGGDGSDLLAGQAGNDNIRGGGGDDTVLAGDGNDDVRGEAGSDELYRGPGDDIVRGGDGNDDLFGSAGNDILLGEGGDDGITGNEGRDVLIGGQGADQMNGSGDDDILIGGTTSFDGDDKRLGLIRAEWTSLRPYASRVADLRGKPNPQFAARRNGDIFLKKGTTVLDDNAVDLLAGDGGFDWFLADIALPAPIDVIVDLAAGEEVN